MLSETTCGDDVTDSIPVNQTGRGSSNLTSPLQNYKVEVCDREEIKDFIEQHHYSKNINGVTSLYTFALRENGVLKGAMLFGTPATRGVAEHYGSNTIELRRLVCVDDTPRNTESFFIGHCLRWLKKNTTHDVVLSYSDLEYGHTGVIYSASNFKKVNTIPGAVKILWNGKLYHDRSMRVKYKGKLKPFAEKLSAAYKAGETQNIATKGKNVWIYRLKKGLNG